MVHPSLGGIISPLQGSLSVLAQSKHIHDLIYHMEWAKGSGGVQLVAEANDPCVIECECERGEVTVSVGDVV